MRHTVRSLAALAAASCLLGTSAAAEVMDKLPTLPSLWFWAALASLFSLALVRVRWWLVFIVLPAAVFCPLGLVLEFHSQDVGPAILQEAGASYVLQAHLALLLVVLANAAGLVWSRRARRSVPSAVRGS